MNDIANLCELVGANVQDVATMYLWNKVQIFMLMILSERTTLRKNIYDIEDMKTEGVEYYSIGRPYVKNNGTVLAEAATAEDQD